MKRKRLQLVLAALVISFVSFTGCAGGDEEDPARITDLYFFRIADNLIRDTWVSAGTTTGEPDTRLLAWTAPGDDGYDGQASQYDIRYIRQKDLVRWGMEGSPRKALEEKWDDARQIMGEPYPSKGGSLEQMFVPRLNLGDTVWFAVRTADEVGHRSGVSNVAGPFRVPLLQIPLHESAGATVDGYGYATSSAGDMNGDGRNDLLMSNPDTGRVTITKGKKTEGLFELKKNAHGVKVHTAVAELTPLMTISGRIADGFGLAASGIHRVNHDSLSDVAAGAPDYDWGSTVDAGAVYVIYGKKNLPGTMDANTLEGTTTSPVGRLLVGETAGGGFGSAVSPAFDLDRDGRAEFLVGAPAAFGTGAVYVFRGKGLTSGSASRALLTIKGEQTGDEFGAEVASISDVNGDEIPDIAVGAPGHDGGKGAVYVFYGGDAGVAGFQSVSPGSTVLDLSVKAADVTIRGTFTDGRFGKAVAAGGNLSGVEDAYYDFAVSGGSTVYVFFGGVSSLVPFPLQGASVERDDRQASALLSGDPVEDFGRSIAGVGDVTRNGRDDLLVGAPGVSSCYLYPGPITGGTVEVMTFDGETASGFGFSVSGVGDVNRDEGRDFLVGAPDRGSGYFRF
ncbi:MAG: hypothetical protein R6V10_02505 [bacterium]